MTHGSGGFSSGGGGGGGGGGFGGIHHGHHGDSDGDCCRECFLPTCLAIGNIVTYLLCLRRNMSRYIRIALLWVYIIATVLAVGILLGLSWLGTNQFQAAPTDMRKVESNVNIAFCTGVTLNSSSPFIGYQFETEPVVDPNSREQIQTSYTMEITGATYEYWGFYLLPGSNLRLRASAYFTGVHVFIIMGENNLNQWMDSEGTCSACYLHKYAIYSTLNATFAAHAADNYYFVFFNNGNYLDTVTSTFNVNRTLYDVKLATNSCEFHPGKTPCYINLSLNQESNVVFHSGVSPGDENINMWSRCQPRVWMYVIVFGVIPILIGLLITLLLWKLCIDDRTTGDSALTSISDIEPNYKQF